MKLKTAGIQRLNNPHTQLSIEAAFDHQAKALPDSVAITDCGYNYSYRALSKRANRIAAGLRKYGVGRGDYVALMLERGVDFIAAMIGTLRTGAAYVPIDPRYPKERCEFIRADCGAVAMVTDGPGGALVTGIQSMNSPVRSTGEMRVAYVIYTSGSTGDPKGVMVTHKNVLRLFSSTESEFNFSMSDVWCGFHSPSFDFSVWEIWGALLFGGRHVIVPVETARDPESLVKLLHEQSVTVLNQTPSAFRNLMPTIFMRGCPPALRFVVFGGERLDVVALRPWVSRFGTKNPILINMYGITETTVHVTLRRLRRKDFDSSELSPIGKPISDMRIRIVLSDNSTAPIGAPGVIHVGGAGVSLGYLGSETLTVKYFYTRNDDCGSGMRWYNSGDLGVQVSPGEFAYIGRADRQLKVRGYRIEPGEVEAALRACAEVIDCIVSSTEFPGGDHRLFACVVVSEGSLQDKPRILKCLRTTLENTLPFYLCPSFYSLVRKFPMTENNKLDIRSCVNQAQKTKTNNIGESQPRELLRNIWSHLLGRERIDDNDDFFDLGGTSFTLIKMLQAVNSILDTTLTPEMLSEGATINRLASAICKQAEFESA